MPGDLFDRRIDQLDRDDLVGFLKDTPPHGMRSNIFREPVEMLRNRLNVQREAVEGVFLALCSRCVTALCPAALSVGSARETGHGLPGQRQERPDAARHI